MKEIAISALRGLTKDLTSRDFHFPTIKPSKDSNEQGPLRGGEQ